ncbi:MAG: hypothetical protein K0Q95_1145 [Bacteroidota bacterium]|jgi:hypothetical protein|nr:hypothetical protein [Bacteroidota bacterium]
MPFKSKGIFYYYNSFFSFLLKEKKQKFKSERFLPALPFSGKPKSKKTKVFAKVFTENAIHPKRHRVQTGLTHHSE